MDARARDQRFSGCFLLNISPNCLKLESELGSWIFEPSIAYTFSLPRQHGGTCHREQWIIRDGQRAEKSISRSSVDYALQIALEGNVAGPKALKIYGSSYVYSLFQRFGLV